MSKWLLLFLLIPSVCFAGVNFSADEDYLSVSDATSLDMGTGDFSVYVRFSTTMSIFGYLVCKGDVGEACRGSDADEAFGVSAVGGGSATCGAYIADNSTGFAFSDNASGTTINDGSEHVCIVNFDRSGNATIYVDNNTDTTFDITGQAATIDNASDFEVGRRAKSGDPDPFEGTVHEVAVWKGTLLDSQDIAELSNGDGKRKALQIKPSSLVLYLPLDDYAAGTALGSLTFKDISGNANDATDTDADGDSVATSTSMTYP